MGGGGLWWGGGRPPPRRGGGGGGGKRAGASVSRAASGKTRPPKGRPRWPFDIQIDRDGGDRFWVAGWGFGREKGPGKHGGEGGWARGVWGPCFLRWQGGGGERPRPKGPGRGLAWDLFAGRIFIRGGVPPELRAGGEFYRSLLDRLRQVAAKWERPARFELRSVYLMASCGGDTCEIQAAVNGLIHEELVELLRGLPWPSSGETYLYKQLFVLRHKPLDS